MVKKNNRVFSCIAEKIENIKFCSPACSMPMSCLWYLIFAHINLKGPGKGQLRLKDYLCENSFKDMIYLQE